MGFQATWVSAGFTGASQDAVIHKGIPVLGLGFLSRSVLLLEPGVYTELLIAAICNSPQTGF